VGLAFFEISQIDPQGLVVRLVGLEPPQFLKQRLGTLVFERMEPRLGLMNLRRLTCPSA
jgi:hypothetical protein